MEQASIPMKDGIRLAATLYMPDGARPGEKYPALLEYLPYRKDDGTAAGDYPKHSYFAKRGYVGVRVDIRGFGASEGVPPEREYSEQEQLDGEQVIAWLANVLNGNGWPTNYDLTGEAIEVGNPGKIGVHRDALGNPTMFQNRDAALAAFRDPFPGEGGQRNELRGPGYFGIDMGLDKETLSFAWEAFNITNSVRFDAAASSNSFDLTTVTNFGVYGSTLTQPRVMQFMLRYSF